MSMESAVHEEMDGEDGGVALLESESEDIDTESSGTSSGWTASNSTVSDQVADSGVGGGVSGTPLSMHFHGPPPDLSSGALPVASFPNGALPMISSSVTNPLSVFQPQPLSEATSISVTETNDHDESEVFPLSTTIFSAPEVASVSSNGNAHGHLGPYFFPLDIHNLSCEKFFKLWRRFWLEHRPGYPPISNLAANSDKMQRPVKVMSQAVDFQGIEWTHLQTDRESARYVRRMTIKNVTNMIREGRDKAMRFGSPGYMANYQTAASPPLTASEEFYSFKQTYMKYVAHWSHHQLRHNLCATSKNALFYLNPDLEHLTDPITGSLTYGRNRTVRCLNPLTDTTRVVMDNGYNKEISCLSAEHGVLMAGGLNEGTYSMKSLSSSFDTKQQAGTVNTAKDGGVNHIHTFLQRRSGLPQSAICANDGYIRVLDCNTNKIVQNFAFRSPVNCSALSPDGRLRVHVSDDQWPILSDADTGEVLAKLPGHEDHGFACAFSPDGVTFATGHQDGIVQVWDARFLGRVAHSLPAEMSGVRSLAFSPLGSGYPVLVMAEPVDFVSIVDARTFRSKQDIQFFGEVAGFSMPPDDRTLFIGNADAKFGGIMEFERTGAGRSWNDFQLASKKPYATSHEQMSRAAIAFEGLHESLGGPSHAEKSRRDEAIRKFDSDFIQRIRYDWMDEEDLDHDSRVKVSRMQRKTRRLALREMHI